VPNPNIILWVSAICIWVVEWNLKMFMSFPWINPLNNSRAFVMFRVKNDKCCAMY